MPRHPIGDHAMTAAERQRRRRERLREEHPVLTDRQKLLAAQAEIAALRARSMTDDVALKTENEKLKARITEMGLAYAAQAQRFRDEVKRRPPKAERPPLPPDEVRDRRIKALITENRNLKTKLSYLTERYEDAIEKVGGMPRESQITIDKVLHPDQRNNASDADKDRACAVWNAWKTSNGKARRRQDARQSSQDDR